MDKLTAIYGEFNGESLQRFLCIWRGDEQVFSKRDINNSINNSIKNMDTILETLRILGAELIHYHKFEYLIKHQDCDEESLSNVYKLYEERRIAKIDKEIEEVTNKLNQLKIEREKL